MYKLPAYLVDPKKMRPNKMTMTDVKIKAFRGSPNLGWTLAKKREAGKPPSLRIPSSVDSA